MKKLDDIVIKDCITKNIKNLNCIFVFPTQICASMWADKSLEFSGISCVAMERFIAWDEFKGSAIKSLHQDKNAVPAMLRSIFAENIILENSREPFFKNIIPPEYAKNARRFSSWISSILPSLSRWKKNFEQKKLVADDEDLDFLEIYNRYKNFLDNNNLFEPAWETPPFNPDGKKYCIFFPEILMDWAEYKEILESSKDIELINIPDSVKNAEKVEGHFFKDSRIEIKNVVHYLWSVHNEKNIAWNKMCVSVPDMDSYGPYLERDFEVYEIPYVLKNAVPLSSKDAGVLFSEILNCYNENFSFDSIKTLLLNKTFPWKVPELNDELILFGQKNNCLCSYEYADKKVDVWQEAFKNPLDASSVELLEPFYRQLKKLISQLVESKSFAEIRTNYFLFREKYFDFEKNDFAELSDKILSRCIAELGSLIDLEENFSSCGIFELSSYYDFFCTYLGEKMYVPQNDTKGVQILPYRTAACAPFDVHVIVNASQNDISVVFKQLGFLNDDKRTKLGFAEDSNVTEKFILLYAMNSQEENYFTCSAKTFDAYAFTNSYLKEVCHDSAEKNYVQSEYSANDSFEKEKENLFNEKLETIEPLYNSQKLGFTNWISFEPKINVEQNSLDKKIKEKITAKLIKNNQLRVSVSDLKKFYSCPRAFLFSRIMDLQEEEKAATLIGKFSMGNLNHKILELYFSKLKEKNLVIRFDEEVQSIPDEYKKILNAAIDSAIEEAIESYLTKQLFLTSKKSIQDSILKSVNAFSKEFNEYSVYKVEESYTYKDKKLNYFFYAKVDCLLSSPDGDLFLIDFKNTKGAIPKNYLWDGEEESIPDFQLALYKYIIEKNLKESQKIAGCYFFAINDEKFTCAYTEDNEENQAKFNMTQNRCLILAQSYADYVLNFNFSPSLLNIENSVCRSCSYKSICRRTFTVSPLQD